MLLLFVLEGWGAFMEVILEHLRASDSLLGLNQLKPVYLCGVSPASLFRHLKDCVLI